MAMQIGLSNPSDHELRPRITVVGCGGAGGNAVNNMIRANLQGVEFVVTNTDNQALGHNLSSRRIQLGTELTRGLGAGAKPEIGRAAAEECIEEIMQQLDGSNMVFITAGMGGGTGTGAAPVIARAARERGILTVGVVTKPFHFEGAHRMRLAENGILDLQQYVDTLIIIPNQNLFRLANERTTFADAFKMADDVLHAGVRGVTDLMMMPGLINLDFADIRTVMSEMGKAMMGTGEATGDRRALDAAEAAISNPLLDDASMKGARAVLINITGGLDMTLFEADEAANRIREEVDPDANIIFGSTFDESLEGRIRVSVVATGIESEAAAEPRRPQIALVTDATPRAPQQNSGQNSGQHNHNTVSHSAAAIGSGYSPMVNAPMHAPHHPAAAAPVMSTETAPTTSPTTGPAFGVQGNLAVAPQPVVTQSLSAPVRPQAGPSTSMSGSFNPAPRASAPAHTPPAHTAAAPSVDGGFIPPRPVEASMQPAMTQRVVPSVSSEPTMTQPTSVGNAALAMQPIHVPTPAASSASAKDKNRAPSLFERFTNPLSAGRRPEAAPAVTASAGSRVQGGGSAPTAPTAAASPRLSDAGTRPISSQADDDLLEIPAFLRRQAN
jgi:cell division protein FtsZ